MLSFGYGYLFFSENCLALGVMMEISAVHTKCSFQQWDFAYEFIKSRIASIRNGL